MAYDEEGPGTFAALAAAHQRPWSPPQLQGPTERASGWLRRRGIEINERGEITNISGAAQLPYFEEGEMVLGITAWCAVLRETSDDGIPRPFLAWEQWRYYRVMQKRKEFGKYYSTPGFPRGRVLGVGGERGTKTVYVGEGVLDALAVLLAQESKGIPWGSAYYTFGAAVTRDQAILLHTMCEGSDLVLAFDSDQAGMDATFALLRVFPNAKVLQFPGKDPGEGLLRPEGWHLTDGMEWLHGRTK